MVLWVLLLVCGCLSQKVRGGEGVVEERRDVVNNILADWHYQFERFLKVIYSHFNIGICEWYIGKIRD